MFVFAKREYEEEHVARKQQKIQIGVDFLGIWEFMICCAWGSARGDYYLIAGEDEPESRPIGIWGQRHLRYLNQHHKVLYSELLISGKLNDYLADLNEQAEDMFSRLVKQLAEKEGVTEAIKAENQMLWV